MLPAAPGGHTLVPADSAGALSAAELDVIFPIIHGRGGEDGALQGLLETLCLCVQGPGPSEKNSANSVPISANLVPSWPGLAWPG